MEQQHKQEFYFAVYDKEDTYDDNECLTTFDTEDEARDFVNTENAGYGYKKLYYIEKLYADEEEE